MSGPERRTRKPRESRPTPSVAKPDTGTPEQQAPERSPDVAPMGNQETQRQLGRKRPPPRPSPGGEAQDARSQGGNPSLPTLDTTPQERSAVPRSSPAGGGPGVPTEGTVSAHGPSAFIRPDNGRTLGREETRKTDFLSVLEAEVTWMAEEELASTSRTTRDCPWIAYWFRYYQRRDHHHLIRSIERYAPETATATRWEDVVTLVRERARDGLRRSLETGRMHDVPPGVPAEAFLSRSGSSVPAGEPDRDPFDLSASSASGARPEEALRSDLGLGEGSPLDTRARTRMESVFGADLSGVRVHTDPSAQTAAGRLHARAFAMGSDVAMAPGRHQPGTLMGDALLAHELAHVLQQRGDREVEAGTTVPMNQSPAIEADANRTAMSAMQLLWSTGIGAWGGTAGPGLSSGPRISRCDDEDEEFEETKTVTVTMAQFTGSTLNPDDHLAFANEKVFNQANIEIERDGPVEEVDLGHTRRILGKDLMLDTEETEGGFAPTEEGTALLSSDMQEGQIPVYYVEEFDSNLDPDRTSTKAAMAEHGASCSDPRGIVMNNRAIDQTLSHEIGHILLGPGGHEDEESNLMYRVTGDSRTDLTPSQIAIMRKNDLAR